jgi:hypothetical protein
MRRSGALVRKIHEGVALLADPFRHLCEIDHVEIKERVRAQQPDYIAPCQPETLRTRPSGEISGQQGCIVVAKLRSQPSQPSNWTGRVDCELENEENFAIGFGSDHDRGNGSARAANVTLPVRQPAKRLKDGKIRSILKLSPLRADLFDIVIGAQLNSGARRSGGQQQPCAGKRRTCEPWELSRLARRLRLAGRLIVNGATARMGTT